jgi:transposase, IS30 family
MSYYECIRDSEKSEHVNYSERKTIERMLRKGASRMEIAKALYRDKSTIRREIKRGSVVQRKKNPYESKKLNHQEYIEYELYYADVGQRSCEENRSRCGARNKVLQCADLVAFVEEKILSSAKWSPDAAIGYAKANKLFDNVVSTKTFYNWIDDGLVKIKNIDLLLKVRRQPSKPRQERKKKLGKSIDERPKDVDTREEFGHWEGDGIVGKDHKGHLISLVERKLGIGMLFNVGDRTEEKIVLVIDHMEKQFGTAFSSIFKSITFDNGSEFSRSDMMEQGGRTQVYYAHPYSSWERATNENWNGIVRRFIPKGSSFNDLTDEDLERITHYINTLPRKRFGYKSPMELWAAQIHDMLIA